MCCLDGLGPVRYWFWRLLTASLQDVAADSAAGKNRHPLQKKTPGGYYSLRMELWGSLAAALTDRGSVSRSASVRQDASGHLDPARPIAPAAGQRPALRSTGASKPLGDGGAVLLPHPVAAQRHTRRIIGRQQLFLPRQERVEGTFGFLQGATQRHQGWSRRRLSRHRKGSWEPHAGIARRLLKIHHKQRRHEYGRNRAHGGNSRPGKPRLKPKEKRCRRRTRGRDIGANPFHESAMEVGRQFGRGRGRFARQMIQLTAHPL